MTDTAQQERWNRARNSMLRFELAATWMSRGRLAGIFAFGAAAILLVVVGGILNVNLNRLHDSLAWVQHSNDVLLEVSGLQQSFAQAESGAHAYALTSDGTYLWTLGAARGDVGKHLHALRDLVADNPVQSRSIATLSPLFGARLSLLTWFVHLGPVAGRALAISSEASAGNLRRNQKHLTNALNSELNQFRDRERGLLASRQVLAQRDTEFLNVLALLAAVIAASCGALGIYLLVRAGRDTRARALQMELMHVQRLGVMGQNSATLAHEINQPLTAATNFLGALEHLLAVSGATNQEKLQQLAQRAASQITRVGAVVKRLREFVEKRDGESTIEEPAALVADAVALFATFDASAKLDTAVAPGLPDLLVDRIQIQQVLVNLMRNALEAMRDSPRRELRLAVSLGKNDCVQFSLRDTGPGLSHELAGRLFQPFVSTKQDGMGVGLSICRKIIDDHGGRIWAEPADGGGAVFNFAIPALRLDDIDIAA